MFDKGKREQRHDQEDAVFNKMLFWLLGAVAAELFVLLVKQVYVNFIIGVTAAWVLDQCFRVFAFPGAALTAAGIVWVVMNRRKGKSTVVPCICAVAVGCLWALSVLGHFMWPEGVDIMLLLPVGAAVLIVVFFLYQRVFFYNALLTASGLLVLWMRRQYSVMHPTITRLSFAAEIAVLAAALVLSFLLRRGDGKLGALQIMPPDTDYTLTWATCIITALAMAMTLVLDASLGLYLLFGLAAWVFIQAVFFTVRLM